MATLQGLDHIGEKIFKFHQGKDIINFRLVCKSWKQILDNPMYWLKKLNGIGQTKKAFNETLVLIRKASRSGIQTTKIGYCLLIKFIKITENNLPEIIQRSCKALYFRLPMLYFALIPKEPDLALIRLFAKSMPKMAKPTKCARGLKYIRGRVVERYSTDVDPLSDAVEGKQSLEVIKILISELKDKVSIGMYVDAFLKSVKGEYLGYCKYFCEKMTESEFEKYHKYLFEEACKVQNIPILELLMSKKKGQFGFLYPFYAIIDSCYGKQYLQKLHKCVEMTKLFLPKLQKINEKNKHGETIFDIIDRRMSLQDPCLLEIIKVVAPLCNTVNYSHILKIAVARQDFELVKEYGEKLAQTDLSTLHKGFQSSIHYAISKGYVDVLKYLISKNKVLKFSKEKFACPTPLHMIVELCIDHYFNVHRCVEMAKLVLPKIEDINACNTRGESLLDKIVKNYQLRGKNECIFEILKLIAPVCKLRKDIEYYPPKMYEILKPYAKRKLEEEIEITSVNTNKKSRKD